MLDGYTLKRIRLLNHKSQVQVAEGIGVSERYIKYMEANEVSPSEVTYNDYLNFCYKGIVSEKAKQKKAEAKAQAEAEKAMQAEKAEAEKPRRRTRLK